jgi:hypothetical protein
MSDPHEVFKNVRPYAVDVGGRLVAPGEIAELPPTRRAVDHAVDAGHLVPLNTTPNEADADQPAADQPSATSDAQPVNAAVDDDAPSAPVARRLARTRTSTPSEES